MKTTRAAQQVTEHGAGVARGHPRERTGVRFVLTNAADSSQTDDYSAWYDDYERAIIHQGLIANAFRFETPDAAGTEIDPRYAALYDIVSPDPASAWPATENSPDSRATSSTTLEAAWSCRRSALHTRSPRR